MRTAGDNFQAAHVSGWFESATFSTVNSIVSYVDFYN